ncbi:hypothetical protein HQN64_24290 [Enterobacteriaceae bacterium BIT-l23]|nr:hypothetical protein [Enterobacteriaceae bacterium BIT-l23]
MMTPSHAGEGAGAAEISRDITLPFRNENGLIEERATRTLFRFDTRAPGVIRKDGFGPSRDFSYIPDMLNTAAETEKTLIVSETEEGVKAYSNLMGDRGYIYKINVTNARGVSLAKNFQENKDALLDFMRNRRYPGVRDLDYRETRIGELLEESLDYKEYHLSTDDVFKGSIEVLG